ncbi:hypothetical protein SBA6_330011 [Candidatus Sulfopaludibacter sp. SbA6]|nr:hypothetical protein SBA6_330011 [Candidatus Sulfopaludibacter sp. SbA6]
MDVEKTMEFILDQLAQTAALQAQAEVKAEERAARHDREIQRIDNRLDRAIKLGVRELRNERRRRQEMDARWDEKMTQLAAAQLLTEEKQQHLDVRLENLGGKLESMGGKLESMGRKLEGLGDKLEGLIDALRRGGNGSH